MNLFLRCLLLFGICLSGNAFGALVASDVYGTVVSWDENTIVADGIMVAPNQVNVIKTMWLENYGVIKTNISLCDSCDLFVKNTGDISANLIVGTDAKVFHVITDENNAKPIGFDVGYTVLVDGANNLTLQQVADAASRADKVILTDSVLDFESDVVGVIANVELNGEVKLKTDSLDGIYNRAIFTNVSGDGRVVFLTDEMDVLYVDEAVIENSMLYVRRRRETDYTKIFNNDVGMFLNGLRSDARAVGLMSQMDGATDMDDVRSVMNKSVRFNANRLYDVMRQISMFDDGFIFGGNRVAVSPHVIVADDFYSYGIAVNAAGQVFDDLAVGVNMRVGRIEYDNNIDAFDGIYYGATVSGGYMWRDAFVREAITMNAASFNIGNVMYDGVIYHNPDVLYGNSITDVGVFFGLSDVVYVAPFVGMDVAMYNVADLSEMDMFVRGGVGAGIALDVLGVQYEYTANLYMNTGGEVVAMGRVGFWSEYDMAGGDVGIGISRHDNRVAYMINATAKIWF